MCMVAEMIVHGIIIFKVKVLILNHFTKIKTCGLNAQQEGDVKTYYSSMLLLLLAIRGRLYRRWEKILAAPKRIPQKMSDPR